MIDEEKYNEILESGLTLDHYFLLCNIKNGVKLLNNKRIQGFINLLTKKDYIRDDALTEKALDLVANCQLSKVVEVDAKKINVAEWAETVHEKCVTKLMALTGKKQIRGRVQGRSYPFMCNPTDLAKSLTKIITLYKIKDYDKVERMLMRHIESCHKEKVWFPVMQYYIIKENTSKLVTDMMDNEEEEVKEGQFAITKTKDLF